MPPCQPLSLCLSPRKLCAASSSENTCITPRSELQFIQPETRNASRPEPVTITGPRAGSVFDHINDHRQHRSTRKTWFQRCPKSNQNQLKIVENHCKLPEKNFIGLFGTISSGVQVPLLLLYYKSQSALMPLLPLSKPNPPRICWRLCRLTDARAPCGSALGFDLVKRDRKAQILS